MFKSTTRPFPDRIGLAHVDSFSSVEGIPIYKDHEYELVSVYNNITDKNQDSMAVMNLYMLDKDFVAADPAARTEPGFEPTVLEPSVDGASVGGAGAGRSGPPLSEPTPDRVDL